RKTAQSVYSVSPDTGVVTAFGKGLSAGAGLAMGLGVMGSIILWSGCGICEFAEFTDFAVFVDVVECAGNLLPSVCDDGGQPDPGDGLTDGDDTVGHRYGVRRCPPVDTAEASDGAYRNVNAEQDGGIR